MDYYQACTKLAEHIKNDDFYDDGAAIQIFTDLINDQDETPAMALALIKSQYGWEAVNNPDT